MPNSQQEEHVPGHADARTPDPGANSAPGDLGGPTLYEFLTRLATSPDARQAFDADPRASLDQAGLGEMTAADVLHATSLVLDYAPVEVAENYGRTLQDSADKFATSSQYAAINHLHPAHSHEQEVTELNMLNNPPANGHHDFSGHGDTNIEVEQNDSHNLVSVHDVVSDNNVANIAAVGNTVGGAGDTVNSTVENVTGTVDNTVDTAGDLTANVGDVTGVVGGVAGGLPVVGDVAGSIAGADASALPVEDLAGGVGGTLESATEPVGGVVETATAPVEPVLDTATAPVEPVTSALPVGDVVNTLPAPSELPVVGDVAGGAVENVAGALPLDGLL